MRVFELAVLYGLIGLGSAVVLIIQRKDVSASWLDALLLGGFWPVYGPFLLAKVQGANEGSEGREVAFLAALRKVKGTPLAALLPDQQTIIALTKRLRVAAAKVQEINSILTQPEFQEKQALTRQRQLRDRGASECAQSTASMRIQNIRRLRALRNRFTRELDEVQELLSQLHTQAEVVRLAGVEDEQTKNLVQEIVSRVEGLDRMLDDDPSTSASGEALRSFDMRLTNATSLAHTADKKDLNASTSVG